MKTRGKYRWIVNKPYEYKINLYKLKSECIKLRPWVCS